ncbi:hypothetical protein BOTBODRAFT_180013 [Botryobasidium botryosum FD-172 SS1]|uniref:RNase III domain-containing protein n=1 Tax=Botryobasidium botryosum (strain FD-172 SS1) TaxID=930990 RepID=A0A067LXX7_BOTB1|nr:hypothetical protein BOTBODRAFT_180013 [Botryobasidium botryosum FD-172 SS1]
MALAYVGRTLIHLHRFPPRPSAFHRLLHVSRVSLSSPLTAALSSFSPSLVDGLPILLPLEDEETRKQVFTHRSFYGRPTSLFEDPSDDPSPDNEFLEYIGDSILNMCAALMIKKMYPNLRVGPATKIRSLIVQNTNIATISTHYRLPALLRMHAAQAVALRASTHVQADLFEAYVGGLFVERGMDEVRDWLFDVLRPYAETAYESIRKEYIITSSGAAHSPPNPDESGTGSGNGYADSDGGHLPYLNQVCAQKGLTIEWKFLPSEVSSNAIPQWIVECWVEGKCQGTAKASTKKKAKHEAARHALIELGFQMPS